MNTVVDLAARSRPVELDALVAGARGQSLRVGDDRILALLTGIARRLRRPEMTRRFPEFASLGYFLRPAELTRLAAELLTDHPSGARSVPRGLVFHVPPANVDTVFVYSWALSALCGNSNITRMSARSAGASRLLLELIGEELAGADPAVAASQRFVEFDHDSVAFPTLSRDCDVRVVWGGDNAVAAVRRHPLAPHATEITFPDRFSSAVLSAAAVNDLDDAALHDVTSRFANDVWWFDQAACSSPRAVYWVGTPNETERARQRWADRLEVVLIERDGGGDPSMAMERRVAAYGLAIDGAIEVADFSRPRMAHLTAKRVERRGWFGAGGFIDIRIDRLSDLAEHVERKDQTITHFGFTTASLSALVEVVGGRGIDRLVPVGEALQFERIWDGVDLPRAFTRWVTIRGGTEPVPDRGGSSV